MTSSDPVPDVRALWKATAIARNNGDFIRIKTYSSYSLEIEDPKAHEYLLKSEASDEELGLAITEALNQSRFLSIEEAKELRANAPENYINWIQKTMSRYGYKTKRALFKNMQSCGISSDEGIITIRPTHHSRLESWDGEGITEANYVKVPADIPPAEIGKALRLAFSRCTGMGA